MVVGLLCRVHKTCPGRTPASITSVSDLSRVSCLVLPGSESANSLLCRKAADVSHLSAETWPGIEGATGIWMVVDEEVKKRVRDT
jgi:hypothetical protein